ncbi:MAG: hypothetical protein MRZ79_06045 [Bacteroidia bacterium]|nr:hypothetical protein [Bacteroidia bacterium]
MNRLIFTLIISLFSISGMAQYQSVVFDYELGYFNNGQPLPAESRLLFNGEIADEVCAVSVEIRKPNSSKVLYEALWQEMKEKSADNFQLPVNYPLTGKTDYDFHIIYYRKLRNKEKRQISEDLFKQVQFYREQQIKKHNGKIKLLRPAKKLSRDFNQILYNALFDYRSADESVDVSFSSMFETFLSSLERDTLAGNADQLDDIFERDITRIMEHEWWAVSTLRKVQDYPTENKGGALALNIGYGGALLSTKPNNFTYGTAPYIGLSLPFSSKSFASSFWQNTSVSVGAFTQNFQDEDREFTGPIFRRPYFVGLGYKVFRFVRLNAGVVALEEQIGNSGAGNSVSFDLSNIKAQPFIGLSAEIKFSLGNK